MIKNKDIEAIKSYDLSRILDKRVLKLIEHIIIENEICCQKILKSCGKDVMNLYFELESAADRSDRDAMDLQLRLENDLPLDRREGMSDDDYVFGVIKERGHEFLQDSKPITFAEIINKYKELNGE